MNSGLLDLILFSEKRKEFLLFLKAGPKSKNEIFSQLPFSRTSLLPQIKKLKERKLVVQKDEIYQLSLLGRIIVDKMQVLLQTFKLFEKNKDFWISKKISPIPPKLRTRIHELGDPDLIQPDTIHAFELNPEFVKHVSDSSWAHMFISYFHPQFPGLFIWLAEKGIEISLVMSESVYVRFAEELKKSGAKFPKMSDVNFFVLDRTPIEIPVIVVVSENMMILGLFNGDGKFNRQYLAGFEPGAIKWGEELFEYYLGMTKEIKLNGNLVNGNLAP